MDQALSHSGPKKNRYSQERRCEGSCCSGGSGVLLFAASEAVTWPSRGSGEASSSGMRWVNDMMIVSLRSSSRRRKSTWFSRLRVYLSWSASETVVGPTSWPLTRSVLDSLPKVSR